MRPGLKYFLTLHVMAAQSETSWEEVLRKEKKRERE